MTFFADLGSIDYFRDEYSFPGLRAVGWLGAGHPFPQGEVSLEFFEHLCSLLVDPWEPAHFRGFHECEFCPPDARETRLTALPQIAVGDQVAEMGVLNLFVPGESCVYVAPSLVAHYIQSHRYSPPHEFVQAVLRCPETQYERCEEPRGVDALLAIVSRRALSGPHGTDDRVPAAVPARVNVTERSWGVPDPGIVNGVVASSARKPARRHLQSHAR